MGSMHASVRPPALLVLGLVTGLGLTACSGSWEPSAPPAGGGAGRSAAAPAPADAGTGAGTSRPGGWTAIEPEPPGDGKRGFEVDPAQVPRSTFAMDVDTASYDHARSVLQRGARPSPERVRPEEFVNAFHQDYPEPAGNGFTVTLDGARLPRGHADAGDDVRLLRVGLQTRAEDRATRPDAALTVVVDVSGSMGDPGKLDVVRRSLHALVDEGRPRDTLALVAFSDEARILRPATPLRERARLHEAIDGLFAQGGTGLEAGLVTGYEVAREGFREGATNRVVLLSDGIANVGATDATAILERVREQAAKRVTLLGVAVGRDYADDMMEQLADRGDGFVVYADDAERARRAFVDTLPAALPVRALDAKVQVTFDPRTVAGYRLVGYENRRLAGEDFRDDRVDGGEVFAGHAVTALYLVRLRPGAEGGVATTQLRWQDPGTREPRELGADVTVADLDGALAASRPRLQVDYAAASFAEQLRDGPRGAQVPAADLARIADAAAQATEDPAVRELAELIRRAAE